MARIVLLRLMLAAGFYFLFACPKRNKKDPGKRLQPVYRKQLCGSGVHSDELQMFPDVVGSAEVQFMQGWLNED